MNTRQTRKKTSRSEFQPVWSTLVNSPNPHCSKVCGKVTPTCAHAVSMGRSFCGSKQSRRLVHGKWVTPFQTGFTKSRCLQTSCVLPGSELNGYATGKSYRRPQSRQTHRRP